MVTLLEIILAQSSYFSECDPTKLWHRQGKVPNPLSPYTHAYIYLGLP